MLLSFQSFSCCKCKIGRYILFVSSGICVDSMWHSMWHTHDKTVGGDLQEFGIFLASLSFSLWISSELSLSLEMGGCGIEGVTAKNLRICIC